MSSIRVYLKQRPQDTDAKLLSLSLDEYGWYYQNDIPLEIFELPNLIASDNVSCISVFINHLEVAGPTRLWERRSYGEYRHEGSVGFYSGEHGGTFQIRTTSIETAKAFWRLMLTGKLHLFNEASSMTGAETPPVPAKRPNRIVRAITALCGKD